jgi:hypothetical protein
MLEESGLKPSHISAILEFYPKITVDARPTVEEFGLPMLPSYRFAAPTCHLFPAEKTRQCAIYQQQMRGHG